MKRLEQFYLFLFLRDFLFKHLKKTSYLKKSINSIFVPFFLHSVSFFFIAGAKGPGALPGLFPRDFHLKEYRYAVCRGRYCCALQ